MPSDLAIRHVNRLRMHDLAFDYLVIFLRCLLQIGNVTIHMERLHIVHDNEGQLRDNGKRRFYGYTHT